MTKRKTCGTCGPDGGRCEWANGSLGMSACWCRLVPGAYPALGECGPHIDFRQATERAEAAEARISELDRASIEMNHIIMDKRTRIEDLEGALKMCAGVTDCGSDDVCALDKIESIVSIALEASDD